MKNLNVKLDIFEGPFDLLLRLIDNNKIDIYNIPISKLTDDYLSSIRNIQNQDMNELSEFIVVATTLLEIKSKMLLPKQKYEETLEEVDPREELVQKLIEYKKYKLVAEKLSEKDIFINKVIFKPMDIETIKTLQKKDDLSIEEILDGISLQMLYNTFEDILKRKEAKKDKIRSEFKFSNRPVYNIKDKISYIKDLVFLENKISFNKIFQESNSKVEIVVTFLAVLELIKLNQIKVFQDDIFSEIIITKGETQ